MKNPEKTSIQKSLKKGHQLIVREEKYSDQITICNAEGNILFSIEISESGTTLKIEATNIELIAKEKLSLNANEIQINSKTDTKIASQGDFKNFTKGDAMMLTEGEKVDTAKIQTIKSELGNVDIVANDDVTLKGERVKLN